MSSRYQTTSCCWSARSRYRGRDDYDRDEQVFSADGSLERSFLLGNGIQDVQTTQDKESM
jgi:hypothetical protein